MIGLLLGFTWLSSLPVQAASVDLEWDPPLSSSPSGYRLYYGPKTRYYTNSLDVGAVTTATVCCLTPGGTYFFASTAYQSNGDESPPSAEFVYHVPDPNALMISPVQDLLLLPKSEGSVSFGVRLGVTVLSDLEIRLTSSNAGFLPETNLVARSSGTNFTVSILPLSGTLGSATVTITATDLKNPSRVATEQFGVSVTSLETASTMNAIGNRSIAEDSPVQTVVLAGIGSPVTKTGGTLKVTATSSNPGLIPHPAVQYVSPSTTGTLTFAPVLNGSGFSTITVTLKDVGSGLTLVTRTFNVSVWDVNDYPTLGIIPNVGLPQNAPKQVVSLSGIGSGAPNEMQNLIVQAVSSNPALIPDPVVSYVSPGPAGTLSFTPAANASGTSTITVKVDDGQSINNLTTRSFTVLVTSSNAAPSLDAIASRSVAEDSAPQTVSLNRISTANGNTSASITAVSSNPSLIPHPKVSYQSPATSGTLTFAPVPDMAGIATIKVTLNDGRGAPNSKLVRSFNISVWDVNDAPTIEALADLDLPVNPGTQVVNLQGISTGASNELQDLTVTATSSDPKLIPNPKVTYTSPSSRGSLSFTPVAGAVGVATITVRVDDGQGFNSPTIQDFTVTLGSPSKTPSIGPIADLTVAEDGGQHIVPVQVNTPNGRGAGFRLLAVAEDEALITSIDVVGPDEGGAASVAFRSAPDASGKSSIALILDDGKGTARSLVTNSFQVEVVAVNDPPTINPISNRTITLDSEVHIIPLAGIGSGAPNESESVVITAISSDPTCIPNPLVVYSSPSATGRLILTPVHNATGSSTITVVVNDGQATNNLLTRIFNVKVSGPSGTPTIDPIPGLRIPEDAGPQSVVLTGISSPFGIGAPTLTVSASSSNPEVIPSPTVTYVNGSTQGKLTFVPAPDASGVVTISVMVQDSLDPGNVTVTSFAVSVGGVNDPPALDAIADLSVSEDSGIHTVALTGIRAGPANEVQSVVFRASSSNPAVVPHPEVHYVAGSDVGALTFAPLPDAVGTVVITVTADDGQSFQNLVTRSFVLTVVPTNDPPTLDPIPDLILVEDAAFQSIPLTGISAGASNEADELTIAASSSDPALIPDPTIVYQAPGTSGVLLLAPAPDAFGTATIRVVISDGQAGSGQVIRSFSVTVKPVDDPPTLDFIPDLTLDEDEPALSVSLTGIGPGASNEWDSLVVTATSSNPELIPTPTISYLEGDTVAGLLLNPSPHAYGTTSIRVEVADRLTGSSRIHRVFQVEVKPVNDPPTLSPIPDLIVFADSGAVTVELSGIGAGAPNESDAIAIRADSSDPSLLLNPQVVYSYPASSGTLTFTPAPESVGEGRIVVTVDDGQAERSSTQRSFMVTVLPPPTNSLWIEAESGALQEPMAVGTHTNASGGAFVFSPIAEQGVVSFDLQIPRSAGYVLWALVQPPDLATQWFSLSIDGAPELLFGTTNALVAAAPMWIRLDADASSEPRLIRWDAGLHQLRIRAAQENVILDALYLTTDRLGLPPGLEGGADPEHEVDTIPPYPWISADLGLPPIPGSARFAETSGTFYVRGSGNIGATEDHFHFLYQTLSGDGVISARLSSVQGTGANERIGLMLREGLDPGSPYVFLGTSGQNNLVLQSREAFATESSANLWTLTNPPEVWIQLSREGDTVYAFTQIDGVAWQLIATINVAMGSEVYFGMAVASEDPQSLALPSFSGVIAAP